jgi:hypothetical protein
MARKINSFQLILRYLLFSDITADTNTDSLYNSGLFWTFSLQNSKWTIFLKITFSFWAHASVQGSPVFSDLQSWKHYEVRDSGTYGLWKCQATLHHANLWWEVWAHGWHSGVSAVALWRERLPYLPGQYYNKHIEPSWTKTWVCGTIHLNHGLLEDLVEDSEKLKPGHVTFQQKQDVLVLILWDKWLVYILPALHTETAYAPRKGAGSSKAKSKCVTDCNTYTHGMDATDHRLSYYPIMLKMLKWLLSPGVWSF